MSESIYAKGCQVVIFRIPRTLSMLLCYFEQKKERETIVSFSFLPIIQFLERLMISIGQTLKIENPCSQCSNTFSHEIAILVSVGSTRFERYILAKQQVKHVNGR
jgi:hypothetical protein